VSSREPLWSADDRRWFQRHPRRSYRLRRPFKGEGKQPRNVMVGEQRGSPGIVIWQMFPGCRLRLGVEIRQPLENTENNACRLFCEALPPLVLSADQLAQFHAAIRVSDNCHGCGRPLQSGEPTLLGTTREGTPIDVALCCVHQLGALAGFSIYYTPKDIPSAMLAQLPPEGKA